FAVSVAGTGDWLPPTAQVTDEAPEQPRGESKRAQTSSAPQAAAPPAAGSAAHAAGLLSGGPLGAAGLDEPGAQLVVVDVTGAFVQWFTEQLRNPDFVFSRGNGHVLEQGDYRAVLLVNPHALNDANLRARD